MYKRQTKDHPILRQARMDETGRLRVSMEEVTRHECILSGKDTICLLYTSPEEHGAADGVLVVPELLLGLLVLF